MYGWVGGLLWKSKNKFRDASDQASVDNGLYSKNEAKA